MAMQGPSHSWRCQCLENKLPTAQSQDCVVLHSTPGQLLPTGICSALRKLGGSARGGGGGGAVYVLRQQQQTYYPYHFHLNIPLCFEIREEYEQTNRFYHFQALEHTVIVKSSKLTTRHNSCTSCCMKESNVSHLKPKYGSFRNKKTNKCESIRNHTNKMQSVTQLIILWKKKLKEPMCWEHTDMNNEKKREGKKVALWTVVLECGPFNGLGYTGGTCTYKWKGFFSRTLSSDFDVLIHQGCFCQQNVNVCVMTSKNSRTLSFDTTAVHKVNKNVWQMESSITPSSKPPT